MRVARLSIIVSVAMLALNWSGWAVAGPVRPHQVDADARWVVHLDVDGLIASSFGPLVEQAFGRALDGIGCARVRQLLAGTDQSLTRQVSGVTLYGFDTQKPQAVLLVTADPAVETLFLELAAGMPGFEQTVAAGEARYAWMEGPRRRVGRVVPLAEDRIVIVVAHTDEDLDRADAVLCGEAASLAAVDETGFHGQPWRPSAGSLLLVMASGPLPSAGGEQSAKLTQHASGLLVEIAEADGRIRGDLVLTAHTQRAAEAMVQILHGAWVMAQIAAQEQDRPTLVALLDDPAISREGTEVAARVRVASARVQEHVRRVMERAEVEDDLADETAAETTEKTPATGSEP